MRELSKCIVHEMGLLLVGEMGVCEMGIPRMTVSTDISIAMFGWWFDDDSTNVIGGDAIPYTLDVSSMCYSELGRCASQQVITSYIVITHSLCLLKSVIRRFIFPAQQNCQQRFPCSVNHVTRCQQQRLHSHVVLTIVLQLTKPLNVTLGASDECDHYTGAALCDIGVYI